MGDRLVYVSRLVRLPLVEVDGADIGRMADVVLGAPSRYYAPRVVGFVVAVQRRRIFVNINRVAELNSDGVRLRRGSINIHRFTLRPGETSVVSELLNKQIGAERILDVAIQPVRDDPQSWEVAKIALGANGLFTRGRVRRVVPWSEIRSLISGIDPLEREAATVTLMHPAEMAAALRALSPERRRALAAVMQDERLADALEEMSEEEQLHIMEGLDLKRAARVLNEMDADDAADLLAELPNAQRNQLLGAMDPDEANPVRRLLSYEADTAGGLMTPEPVVMPPTATVAEALARIREPDLSPALAAQVFVADAPYETPTGRYRGLVGYQHLLREPPTTQLVHCLDDHPRPISTDAPDHAVAERVSSYDVVAVSVVDSAGRLVGAVTVDDVLAHLLPEEWQNSSSRGK